MLRLSIPNVGEEAIEAVARVIRSGHLVHGPESEAFEAELAAYLNCREAILVSSGTAALHLALVALGIGPGDAVLVPDFTFPATANVVRLVGATPVLVDVEPDTYCIDLQKLQNTIETWRGPQPLRAIMPVHEFGYPVDMTALMTLADKHGLMVVEDAACALGASHQGRKVGTFGQVGCFSFHPRKTLTTGEGGVLTTNDTTLAERLRRQRNHGMVRTPAGMQFFEAGYNYRLTNFQAAMGRTQLPHLDDWISRRRQLANAYRSLLAPLVDAGRLALPADHAEHSWQTFMVVLADDIDRTELIRLMKEEGWECNLGAQSLASLGLYTEPDATSALRCGPRLFKHGLALPFCEQYTADQAEFVVNSLTKSIGK